MEKDIVVGWMAFEKNCTFQFSNNGELIIRQIFSKRMEFWKLFPNCKATKVRIMIEEVKPNSFRNIN